MSGTITGGIKASQTNKERHGSDFYKRIGSKGGKRGKTGGFASNPELARTAGAKGGRTSARGLALKHMSDEQLSEREKRMELHKLVLSYKRSVDYYSNRYNEAVDNEVQAREEGMDKVADMLIKPRREFYLDKYNEAMSKLCELKNMEADYEVL